MGEWPRSVARRRADAETATREAGRDWFAFVICRIEDDEPIGRADIFEVDRLNGSAGFGMAIGEHRRRGQGLGIDTVQRDPRLLLRPAPAGARLARHGIRKRE